MADSDFGMGYALGADSANNNGGLFGGDGWLGLILFAMIFGGGWGGFGGGFGGGGAGLQGMVTRADINEGFALNNITGGISAIQHGISDSTYALSNAVNSGFTSLSSQLAQCCCDNRAATADLKYSIGSEFCALGNAMQSGFRDVIESNNSSTRAILDFLTQDKISSLQAENQSLKFAASQAQQNAFITANQEAQTAELIRRLGRDCPIPAYWVSPPTPVQVPSQGGCICNG